MVGRLGTLLWLATLIATAMALVPSERAMAAHDDNHLIRNRTGYVWAGVVGYVRSGEGIIDEPNYAAVIDALSMDANYGQTNHMWAQTAVYRGTVGPLTQGQCIYDSCVRNTTGTPHIYTENMDYLCFTPDYSIWDHGIRPSQNHKYWVWWVDEVGPGYCGEYYQWYAMAKSHDNGFPNELRRGPVQSVYTHHSVGAFLEMHNRVVAEASGVSCFGGYVIVNGSNVSCTANTDYGLYLYSPSIGWPLWTNYLDPTNGDHHTPNYGCISSPSPPHAETGNYNPYDHDSLANWYTFRAFGPDIC